MRASSSRMRRTIARWYSLCALFGRHVEERSCSRAVESGKQNGLATAATTDAAKRSPFSARTFLDVRASADKPRLTYRGGRGIAVRPPPLLEPLDDEPDDADPDPPDDPEEDPDELDPDDDGRLAVPLELLPEPGVYPTPLTMRP